MFRRANKVTALLVAAATVLAVVPTAANAAERLGSKDGNITKGFSYTEGKYVYDGYLTDDDDSALYFNDGEKDEQVENYDDYDYDEAVRYGTKYVTVKDGEDEYLLDLSTGKVDEEQDLEDKKSDIESKLKTNLKKADRYEDLKAKSSQDEALTTERVLEGKYGEVWYQYSAYGDSDVDGAMVNGTSYIGFVNDDNKYIDASSLANIYVYSPVKGKTVKFEKFGDTESFGAADKAVDATLKLNKIEVVAQDDDYLYAITTVEVDTVDPSTKEAVELDKFEKEQTFFQKIAKEQGDKEDGAYTPKTVASYQLAGKEILDDDDTETAANELTATALNVKVKDNTVYVTTKDGKNVKMYELKLKKDKIKMADGKDKVDSYIVKKDADGDEDVTTLANSNPVSYDVNGDTWILGKGEIFKYENGDFQLKYTCDRAINNLDVYDEENLIAWDSEGDVFTVLQGGKKADDEVGTKTETTEGTDKTEGTEGTDKTEGTEKVDKAGWDKNADGTWSYYKDGAAVKGQWVQDGNWYYLDANGIMATGWVQDGNWYYMNQSGAMVTGWVNDNGTWYYMNQSGAMLANTTVDGYVLGANGAWIQ